MKLLLVLLVLLGWSECEDQESVISLDQLKGFKAMLKGENSGVLATCKIIFFSELVDYDTADSNCKKIDIGTGNVLNGNLVTVDNDAKNNDLKLLLEMAYPKRQQEGGKWGNTMWVWAGLRKVRNNDLRNPGPYSAAEWEWADTTNPSTYFNWMSGRNPQPDQRSLKFGDRGCNEEPRCFQNQMRINHDGAWDDTWKFKTHPYACDYQGKYVISNVMKTWDGAKTMCENAGLHLAMIRNAAEVEEIKSAMEYFMGSDDDSWGRWDKRKWIWVGGSDSAAEGDWKWLNGDAVATTAAWFVWTAKAGNDNWNGKQHALSFNRDGEFDDSYGYKKKAARPFACQCPGT